MTTAATTRHSWKARLQARRRRVARLRVRCNNSGGTPGDDDNDSMLVVERGVSQANCHSSPQFCDLLGILYDDEFELSQSVTKVHMRIEMIINVHIGLACPHHESCGAAGYFSITTYLFKGSTIVPSPDSQESRHMSMPELYRLPIKMSSSVLRSPRNRECTRDIDSRQS
ncbi:hypothetical protein BDZ89DRAFT_1046840 [Hymenopellis radicata]|nr:hypothetical protein BDZ89DRAFT_1046840 [Hymenopellis radicata]